jgi:hypothetical protein
MALCECVPCLSLKAVRFNVLQNYSFSFPQGLCLWRLSLALPYFPVAHLSRWLIFDDSRCSLLEAACPERIPDKAPSRPNTSLPFYFLICADGISESARCPQILCLQSPFRFRGGRILQSVQSLNFRILAEDQTVRVAIFSIGACLKVQTDFFSILRPSCTLKLGSWRCYCIPVSSDVIAKWSVPGLTVWYACSDDKPTAKLLLAFAFLWHEDRGHKFL